MSNYIVGKQLRKQRIRKKISGTPERPRMSVSRTLNHIGVQVIDDIKGITLASASTNEKSFKGKKGNGNIEAAKAIGALIAERAKAKGIEQVVFDRNGCIYHGRVKALADAARQKGLRF